MFPQRLDAPQAYAIAQAMLDGFNRHYRLFRLASASAKQRFEAQNWVGQQCAQRERIEFYDQRVRECIDRLNQDFAAGQLPMSVWQQAKLHYIGLLVEHCQPELAETFFNSVTTRILHRTHFHNDFIFVRPAVSTEYIESKEPGAQPIYRAYYPAQADLLDELERIVADFGLLTEFEDLPRDLAAVQQAILAQQMLAPLRANFQIQVLASLFYRNKGAYLVAKLINGFSQTPLVLPLLHGPRGGLVIDAALFGEADLLALFSFSRAYFLVDMEIPSAYVQFLHSLMPGKPRGEIYTALGLGKHGKTFFYRDFLHHLRYSSDKFRIAPGIKGMVMLVFDLPSFPYVFKLIKDYFPVQKDTTREQVKRKYQLVKHHDRVGRMADTLEYSMVAFPRDRFEDDLVAEIERFAPSLLEISDRDGDGRNEVIIRHLYIERRMIPLNLYLQEALDAGPQDERAQAQLERCVIDYGRTIKDLVAANIFPGDMLWKNFGVTRNGKVVFYDYDEIEYLTDCNFRELPAAHNEQDEMSAEVWYPVGAHDVFVQSFVPFLLGNPQVRAIFMQHHADLLDPAFWRAQQQRIREGHMYDVFPYGRERRFAWNLQPPDSLEPSEQRSQ